MTILAAYGPFDAIFLGSVLILTTPILIAAVGEMISERAGVLNVGLEGMMLAGAFFSYWATWRSGNLGVGLLVGIAAGAAFGVIMGVVSIEARANQIVAGVGINIVAIGLVTFVYDQVFGSRALVTVGRIHTWDIPLLSDIPGIGKAVFANSPLVFLAFLLVPASWFLLYRTKWGLSIRAAGELPVAADAAGVSVRRVQWTGLLVAASLAGLAGAFLSIDQLGLYRNGLSGGRGYLALVAVIFGRWHPSGVLGASLALGGTTALALRLQSQGDVPPEVWMVIGVIGAVAAALATRTAINRGRSPAAPLVALGLAIAGFVLYATAPSLDLPDQLWRSLPYLIALVVLAGPGGAVRMPSHLTIPYRRGT